MNSTDWSNFVKRLEKRAGAMAGWGCASEGCVFYLEALVMGATKTEGTIPAHSCMGLVGVTGPDDDFELQCSQARDKWVQDLRRRHPALFEDGL